jgi:rubrerythrin
MALPPIETLDQDGAIREAEAAVGGDTRSAFFRKAAVGGGAALTSGAILGMLPELASAKPSAAQDLKILEFALTLEYLEAAFYAEAVSGGTLTGDPAAFAAIVAKHESKHVAALQATIKKLTGKKAPAAPKFDFKNTTSDQDAFVATAFVLENTGVHAYLGQAGNLKSKALLAAAASIVTVEARHAAAIAVILGDSPFSDGATHSITPDKEFDVGYPKAKILKAVKKTKFIKS